MSAGQQASAIGNSATSDSESITGSSTGTGFVDLTAVMVVTVGAAGKLSCTADGQFDIPTSSSNVNVTAYGKFVYRPSGSGSYVEVDGEESLGSVSYLTSIGSDGPRLYSINHEVTGLTPGAAYDVKFQGRQNTSTGAAEATHTGTATAVGS